MGRVAIPQTFLFLAMRIYPCSPHLEPQLEMKSGEMLKCEKEKQKKKQLGYMYIYI